MPNELPGHIVKSYDGELKRLREMIARMGGLAERQVADSADALVRRDTDLAAEVVSRDVLLDNMEREIEQFCIRLLALRQPMAQDLRLILACMKISSDLERIGDYARNGAKRAIVVSQQSLTGSLNGFERMAELVQDNLKGAIDALVEDDAVKADAVWRNDEPIDGIYNGIFRELLTFMMEDPRNITCATHLLFIAKNMERIGDHATNIAERVRFVVLGEAPTEDRPKGDTSTSAVAGPAS